MSDADSQRRLINGGTNGHANGSAGSKAKTEVEKWNEELRKAVYNPSFHGDNLIGDKVKPEGTLANILNRADDFKRVFSVGNWRDIGSLALGVLTGQGLDLDSGAKLIASMSNDSNLRAKIIEGQVKSKYDRMLHPPVTYLGDAFKYRTPDGKFNSALHPHLGQAGAPYAKTVPSKTHPLGALPDPGDLFDRLMAREQEGGRISGSGLSSMLIYHATIIIHDIFRTNTQDKNISDTSSYLDLSPLYGFTEEMQRKVRDQKYKLGLLKPDTFAEDRLLRQPPGVCIMLVMYNRYHNYAATQLRRINENGKFTLPRQFRRPQLAAAAEKFVKPENRPADFFDILDRYGKAWKDYTSCDGKNEKIRKQYGKWKAELDQILGDAVALLKPEDDIYGRDGQAQLDAFNKAWTAAWDKLDDDLFNTARLITCGIYIQISIHDYLRALMGFHNYNTNFTLDPRLEMKDHKEVTRGLGNQVTVEFNLLYRFHCAISRADEEYAEAFIREAFGQAGNKDFDVKNLTVEQFMTLAYAGSKVQVEPKDQTFGLKSEEKYNFTRNEITGLFDDQKMIDALIEAMDQPIANFGPRNIPKCLKPIEILGIIQARKWEIGTLNDFREFFQMDRHKTFESVTKNKEIQDALRDLYEHPDKIELYPGVFCESDETMGADPGPSDIDSALWAAIFSDAITLVRSDRFYTVDWNTNSLTTWGMNQVTPDNDVLKTSVFHRVFQRAFPEWFPSDSIRFFHPFYTGKKNSELAYAQGYADGFRISREPRKPTKDDASRWTYVYGDSNPNRPHKPLTLKTHAQIAAVLANKDDSIVHPARLNIKYLPKEIADVLKPGQKTREAAKENPSISSQTEVLMSYFMEMMRGIVKREFIVMNKERQTYQIDVVKDFAIPVVTRYVADFLGFSSQVRSESNLKAKYSENEIYQHITNCQVFLSYNSDETKLLKRREAFKNSLQFLFELTKEGWIHEANKFTFARAIGDIFKPRKNAMEELGFKVAQEILKSEKNFGRSAAILLLVGLDNAYNSVLAFTSVLNYFISDLYEVAVSGNPEAVKESNWGLVQKAAFDDGTKALEFLESRVLEAQRRSVKLPIIRKALKEMPFVDASGRPFTDDDGNEITIKKGQTIICDLYAAGENGFTLEVDERLFLDYQSSFTEKFAHYHPKHVAALSLTAMIKVLAQMKNLRRGHDTQGIPKRVNIDSSYETYANYMAPMRMREIQLATKQKVDDVADDKKKQEVEKKMGKLFNTKLMKPAVETYLSDEWDEMLPFPTTWKVRFDGFGESTYGGEGLPYLKKQPIHDDIPPWYQPTGASKIGGSFATWDTVMQEQAKKKCPVSHVALTGGCALPSM